jgi:hypothetical protein
MFLEKYAIYHKYGEIIEIIFVQEYVLDRILES